MIRPGDRVGVKAHDHSVMRTVYAATDDTVTVCILGAMTEIPISELSSIVRIHHSPRTLQQRIKR
jgi:hypothetical protein